MAPETSPLLERPFSDQNAIGWDQCFKCRVAKTWGVVYEFDLAQTDNCICHQTPTRWAGQILLDFFNLI
jgi:hypothetical protein